MKHTQMQSTWAHIEDDDRRRDRREDPPDDITDPSRTQDPGANRFRSRAMTGAAWAFIAILLLALAVASASAMTISQPADGSTVTGPGVAVMAQASGTMDSIDYSIDGVFQGTACTSCSTASGTLTFSNGQHNITINGHLGSTTESATSTFTVAPQSTTTASDFTIAVTNPQNGQDYTAPVIVQIQANTTLDQIQVSIDGGAWQQQCTSCSTATGQFPSSTTGSHTLGVRGTLGSTTHDVTTTFNIVDSLSNSSNSTNTSSAADFTIAITSPQNGQSYTAPVNAQIDANTTLDQIQVSIDGGALIQQCTSCSSTSGQFPNTAPGSHTLEVVGTLGNVTHQALSTFMIVDNSTGNNTNTTNTSASTPDFTIAVTTPAADGITYIETPVPVVIAANTTLDQIQVSIDGAPYIVQCNSCSSANGTFPNTNPGQHTLGVIGTLGNVTHQITRVFNIQGQTSGNNTNTTNTSSTPDFTINVVTPSEGATYSTTPVTVDIQANTTLDQIQVSIDGGAWQQQCTSCATASGGFPNTGDGMHTLGVKGFLGAVTHEVDRTFFIGTNETNQTNTTNTTQTNTTQASGEFIMTINSPQATVYTNNASLAVDIAANRTLDSIQISEDNSSFTTACTNCSSFNGSFPNLMNGSHILFAKGTLGGINHEVGVMFEIAAPFVVNTNTTNTTFNTTNTNTTFNVTNFCPANLTSLTVITPPADQFAPGTDVPVVIAGPHVYDRIEASFDDPSNATGVHDPSQWVLLCNNCSSAKFMYPFPWQGGQKIYVRGFFGGNVTTTMNVTDNTTNTTNTTVVTVVGNEMEENTSQFFVVWYANAVDPTLNWNWVHRLDNFSDGVQANVNWQQYCTANGSATTNTVQNTNNSNNVGSTTTGGSGGGSGGSGSHQNTTHDFTLSISSPVNGTTYNSSNVQVGVATNVTVDSIAVSIDGNPFVTECSSCSMLNEPFPNTGNGTHTIAVNAALGNVTHSLQVQFAIATNSSGTNTSTSLSTDNSGVNLAGPTDVAMSTGDAASTDGSSSASVTGSAGAASSPDANAQGGPIAFLGEWLHQLLNWLL